MKLRIAWVTILWVSIGPAWGQSWISNPDFETYTTLPTGLSQLTNATGWFSPIGTSPDYFHTLSTNPLTGMSNSFANLAPQSGQGIAGFISFMYHNEYREFITTIFTNPLTTGDKYELSFWMTNGNPTHGASCSIDGVGALLSVGHPPGNMTPMVGTVPMPTSKLVSLPNQFYNPQWEQIKLRFRADQPYTHLTVGSFYGHALIDTASVNPGICITTYLFVDNFNLDVIPPITGTSPICPEQLDTLVALNWSGNLRWSLDDSFQTILSQDDTLIVAPSQTTTYWVADGPDTNSFTVVVDSISVDLGPDILLCPNTTVDLAVTSAYSSLVWDDQSVLPIRSVGTPGVYWVDVASPMCTARDSIEVWTPPFPTVELGPDSTICPGDSGILIPLATSGHLLWQDQSTDSQFSFTGVGHYWVTLTDTCGNQASDSLLFSEIPPLALDLGGDTLICPGTSWFISAASQAIDYLWQDGSDDQTYLIDTGGQYWVTQSDQCGRNITDSIWVAEVAIPDLDLGPDTVWCSGDTFRIQFPQDFLSIRWEDGSDAFDRQLTKPGLYSFEAQHICRAFSDTLQLSPSPWDEPWVSVDSILCPETPWTVDLAEPYSTYLWQDGTSDATYQIARAGTYLVEISHPCGNAIHEFHMDIDSPPIADLGDDLEICPGDTLWLSSPHPGATYLWQDGATHDRIPVVEAGSYSLLVQDACESSLDAIEVWEGACECNLYIPSAFSPNSDAVNQTFSTKSQCPFLSFRLNIFNAWGGVIFESTDPDQSWDGAFQGIPVPEGVYIYRISYQFEDQPKHMRSGSITLIR
ncbi:gliding motility-associated C-terminal domain-containing protein [Pontibacter sp. G13]|uniref:gliding motility-associated C-terminal domain-containing protein n=1 Tax=Pontibacter sp. G13 TaxID=3074898 RepID=UPI00288B8F5D|nr:gliding motility-associated C-terminal domain-containing protein [Pontibacter sp. G13]WNJ20492.1 gliding motility-associated C-terminal domain-containing protein [Pontibacter sp. G13]